MSAMPPKLQSRPLSIVDLFCGGGGSSEGVERTLKALGLKARTVAVNHWTKAIQTYKLNHPDAITYCQDVGTMSPRQAVPSGVVDLLIGTPTCVYYSQARGGLPTSDQQRDDPFMLITWLTQLRVHRLLVENVPEIVGWGPVDPETKRPIKERKGEYFRAWLDALRAIGFTLEWRILNCADYGDPTTRERFFLMARSDGKPIRWPAPTHSEDGKHLPKWRPAKDIIDWSIRGRSIFGRKKPLVPATLARIRTGIFRFNWPDIYKALIDEHIAAPTKPLEEILHLPHVREAAERYRESAEPVEPCVVTLRNNVRPRDIETPIPSVLAGGTHISLIEPFVLSPASGGAPRAVSKPVPTIVAATNRISHALIGPYYGQGSGETCTPVTVPMPTVTAKARFGFITAAFGERPGQSPRVHSIEKPCPTILAQGRIPFVQPASFDILYRMFKWWELAGATGFLDDGRYEFIGSDEDIIRQIGNAVPCNTAKALSAVLLEDAAVSVGEQAA